MTARNDLVVFLTTAFKNVTSGVNNYTQEYKIVTRDPITDDMASRLNGGEAMVGVYEMTETKNRLFGITECVLPIVIEFYYCPKKGQSGSEELNRILLELQSIVYTDYTLGGIAINTEELSNQIDIDGIYDKLINGSINIEVTYRHPLFSPGQAL